MKLKLNKDAIPFLFYGDKLENTYRHISEDRFDHIMNIMGISQHSQSRKELFHEIWPLRELDVAEIWIWSWYNAIFYTETKSLTWIDISKKMLKYAEENFLIAWISNYSLLLSNSEELKDKDFDLVVMTYALSGCKDITFLLGKALEQTRTWWRIAILDSYNFDNRMNLLMRLLWWHQSWSWFSKSPFKIFYPERSKFRIISNKRLKSEKNNTEYMLILEKL